MAGSDPEDVKSTSSSNDEGKPRRNESSIAPNEPTNNSLNEKGKEEGQPEDGPAIPFSPMREAFFVFTICMAQFLSLAGLAQSVAPLAIIGRSFGVTDEGLLSWYPAAFSL